VRLRLDAVVREKCGGMARAPVRWYGDGTDAAAQRSGGEARRHGRQAEAFVREGTPAGENRSDLFHTIVGHYLGCGWEVEQIYAHLQQFPDGIGGRYLSEGRLSSEIARSECLINQLLIGRGSGSPWA
jgi:hypothetical protein